MELVDAGERAEERLRVLTAAMRTFAQATSDLDQLLAAVARNVAEVLRDSCVLLALSEDGTKLVPRGAHAVDDFALARVHALLDAEPFLLETHPAARAVLEKRDALLVPKLDPKVFSTQTTSGFMAFQRDLGVHSLLAVALHAHDQVLGLLTLTRYRATSPPFDEHDRELAINLADHASLAIANARLYATERSARVAAEEAMRSRRAAEARLEHLSAIIEATPDAIVITDARDHITLVNEEAERQFGYSRAELVQASLKLLIPDYETLIGQRKDGTEFALELTESTLATDEGHFKVRAIRDITERKHAELAIVHARDAAESANRELEAFSYSVAHDLRAPLRSVHGFAEILLEDHGPAIGPDGEKLVRRITTSARKMGELVDGLLALSRVTRSQLKRQPVNLTEMARATLAQAVETRPGTETDVQEDVWADADPTLVRSLLDNLLGNAVKFTAHAKQPMIQFGAEQRDGERVYFVHDNGAGFDMEFSNRLFKPFERLHTDADFAGTGIGLATAQRIVARHGGRIWAEGARGEGATFYFTLTTNE